MFYSKDGCFSFVRTSDFGNFLRTFTGRSAFGLRESSSSSGLRFCFSAGPVGGGGQESETLAVRRMRQRSGC